MPIIEGLGVSAHAIAQFQDRIAPLSEQKAREMILAGIAWATNVRELPDGKTLRVRTRSPFPFEFRAFCVFDEERGHFVVTTIVKGDSKVARKRKRKAARDAAAANASTTAERKEKQE